MSDSFFQAGSNSGSNSVSGFMELMLKIDSKDALLHALYKDAVEKHNDRMTNNAYCDAGFDLFVPHDVVCTNQGVNKVNFGIRVAARMSNATLYSYPIGYFLCPRSSISGTPLRLANSIGIMDSGYRGEVIAKFDCLYDPHYVIKQYVKLVQIVAPGMVPIRVTIVDSLGESTERGEGGFGSTGV